MTNAAKDDAPGLLPCPFCGGDVRAESTYTDATVQCTGCRAKIVRLHYIRTNTGRSAMPLVIAAWNRRTPEALAASPVVQAMLREARAEGMERGAGIVRQKGKYSKPTESEFIAGYHAALQDVGQAIRAEAAAVRKGETK